MPYFRGGLFIGARSEEYDETIDRLDRSVGLDRLRVWHLNDSCRELRQPRRPPRGDRGRAAWGWNRFDTWSMIPDFAICR